MLHIEDKTGKVIISLEYYDGDSMNEFKKSLLELAINTLASDPEQYNPLIVKGVENLLILILSMESEKVDSKNFNFSLVERLVSINNPK